MVKIPLTHKILFHILRPRKSNALSISNNLQIRIQGEKMVAVSVDKKRESGIFSNMLAKTVGAVSLAVILLSCGSGSSPGYSYTIGGIVSGLAADSVIVLQNNAGDDLSISANGSFSFLTPVNTGGAYTVTIETQPSFLSQTCTVSNGSGIVSNAPVSSVVVSCVIPPPQSVTVSGNFAYVANTGSKNISGYTINSNGALTEITGSPGSPFPAGTNPYSVTVDPSGKFAYVANMGDNTISGYTIASNGALIPIPESPFSTGMAPSSVTVVQLSGKEFAYVANTGSNNISVYNIDLGSGVLTEITGSGSPFAAGMNPYSVTVAVIQSSGEQFAYVANYSSNSISAYKIDPGSGALTNLTTVAAGTNPYSVTVDPPGNFAYVANTGDKTISAYTIDPNAGTLTAVTGSPGSPFPAGANPYFVTVTVIPSVGEFAYVANTGDKTISVYSINLLSGALIPLGAPVTAGANPYFVTVTVIPSVGEFAYVANTGDKTISVYRIDMYGELYAVEVPVATGRAPNSVTVVLLSGKEFAYTANYSDSNISGYGIDSTGALTEITGSPGSPFPAGTNPY
jgi:6-phosphogluconolactonase (cycloisomerase 2 family)